MNNTKEVLIKTIKEWMNIEKNIKNLQKDIKINKDKKKQLSENLVKIMKNNDVDCFDISEGKICYTINKIKSSLSKKHIMSCLNTYFADNESVQPDDVAKYILENRSTIIKESIKHKPLKNDKDVK